MTLVILSLASAMLTIVLSGLSSRMSRIVVGATIALTLLLVQVPSLASLLHLTPLHIDDLILSVMAALAIASVAVFGQFGRKN